MKLDIHTPLPKVTTRSAHVDLLAPDHNTLVIDEIAQVLARSPRYNGHSERPVSIGQHLLFCGMLADRRHPDNVPLALQALVHDAHEAYTGDICRPLKKLINDNTEGLLTLIELRLDTALRIALGASSFDWIENAAAVKDIDNVALTVETAVAFRYAHMEWGNFVMPRDDEELHWCIGAMEEVLDLPCTTVEELWCKSVHAYADRLETEEDYDDA
jgi:hypothetical protein